MKKGTDYTISYSCNREIGIASVIIKGKGKYSGTVKKNFKIVPSKPTLTVTSSGGNYHLSWTVSKGAAGYEIYGSTGEKYKLIKRVNASEAGENPTMEIASGGKQYTFKIRAYQKLYPQKFYSNYDVK